MCSSSSGSTRPSACSPQGASCSGSHERRRVVVAEHPEHRLAERTQPLVGHLHPALEALAHEVEQEILDRAVLDPLVELSGLRSPRVVADVGDRALHARQLVLVLDVVAVAAKRGREPSAAEVLDRLHRLAGDVAAEHHHVGLVHGSRVEELAKAHLRAMDIGGEEQLGLLGHGRLSSRRASRAPRAPASSCPRPARGRPGSRCGRRP